jgi:hypothetical protein
MESKGNRMTARAPNRQSGGVFRQPVAVTPQFGVCVFTKDNSTVISSKNSIFRRLLAVSTHRRQVSSSFFRHIEANRHQLGFWS